MATKTKQPKAKKPVKNKLVKKAKAPARPYPRATLEDALKIAYAIKEKNGGNPWPPEDVAKAVNQSKNNRSFFYMAASSRDFGITLGSRDTKEIALTDLGQNIVYAPNPDDEKKHKQEAFLNIDIFKNVLNYYKGSNLPEMRYLGNTLSKEFGLDPETHEEFSDLFEKNCKYLGIGSGLSSELEKRETEDSEKTDQKTSDKAIVTLVETSTGDAPLCFVIMPFNEKDDSHPEGFFDEVLKSLIVPAGSKAGFNVKTANRKGSDVIQSTIVTDLLEADLVLADLTEHNPNVLFELGMRMAEDKPVALIRADGTAQIFDVDNMLRVFEYNPNLWASTVKKDLPDLTEHIKAAWDQRESTQTYIKILRNSKQP